MGKSSDIKRNLISFLEEYVYELWDSEEIEKYVREYYDIIQPMAFEIRDAIQSDKKISEDFKKKLSEYSMFL